MENENLVWLDKPVITRPYMILAFQGWANAGEVPTSILWYMISRMEASLFAELKPDLFYNYQSSDAETKRPVVNIETGLIQSYSVVTTNFWFHKGKPGEHDVVFISGPEPEQGWNQFSNLILDLAQELQVEQIITLGGTFDAIPHTVAPRITGVVSQAELRVELESAGIEPITYKGPSSIHTLLMLNASKRNLPMISLWAHTPHYIQVVNFIAAYAMLTKLTDLTGINIDLDVARRDSEYLHSQVDEAIEKKPELQEYLRTLEVEYRKGKPAAEEPINKNILKEIEDLFKDK